MKYTVTHDLYGQIECTESFWTSKKTVTINGVALKQVGKMKRGQMTYEYDTDEGKKQVIAKGSFTSGIQLLIDGETIQIDKGATLLEKIFCIFMWVILFIWGNSTYLCSIIPIMGGGIGGGLNGVLALVTLLVMKLVKSPASKIIVGLAMFVATVMVNIAVAIVFLMFIL